MTIVLNKKFTDPLQAEKQLAEFMGAEKEKEETDQKSSTESTESPPSGEGMSSSEPLCLSPVPVVVVDTMQEMMTTFDRLPSDQQLQFLSEMFSRFAECHSDVSVPSDYLHLLKEMEKLKESKRVNVLYELSKGLGITRPDGSDTTFPTKRMPMGLLQYMVSFFNSGAGQQVSNPT